jgi:chitinase
MTRALLALLATLALGGGVAASGADFTASSSSPGTTFATAADFNTVAVSISAPAGPLTGTPTVSATATSDRGIASVKLQYAPAGTSDWVDICTADSCPWNTAAVADGGYDLRAIATDSAGYSRTSATTARTLDNYALTVSLADPGANISGTKQLTATAAGVASGLQSLTIQHRAAGATSWTDVCTGTTSPRTCNLVTTGLPDGPRELRAVARDNSGAAAQTAVLTRNIDNSPPSATPSTPTTGSGMVTMTATADDSGSGIAWVAWEALYEGSWYEFCRDTTAPYSCSGDSAMVADGTYSIRIRVRNNAGVETVTSGTQITIDNPPAPIDVQARNGGATAGLLEAGDWVRMTWNEAILPSSVLAGWNGSSQAIRVRVVDNGTNDQMEFFDAAGTTRVNLTAATADLKLGANLVSGAAAQFDATMSQSGASITVTLGAPSGTPTLLTAAAGTLNWKPSAAATDATGHASKTTAINETGGLDVDF